MAQKIGFITFTALDPPSPTEYAAYKKLQRLLEPGNHVKTLAETHPIMPPWRFEAPALNRTPDHRAYKLAAELSPLMDEFHHRVLDRSRVRERLKTIERTRFQNDIAEIKYFRQVDLLHAWISELLFERIYRRIGREFSMFEKAAKKQWLEDERFRDWHREKRIAQAEFYPELQNKELLHPYKFEIRLPNEKKALQLIQEHTRDERRIVQEARAQAHQLQQVLHDIIFDSVKQHLHQQYASRRSSYDKQARWHLHDVLQAFEKAWVNAWESRGTFREPNEKDFKTKLKEHIDQERQQQALVKMEVEADRQLLKNNKLELDTYRHVAADQMEVKRMDSQWQEHVLVERQHQQAIEQRDHVSDAKSAESQGYHLQAGHMLPQPRFGVDADLVTRVPLTLGLSGDPRAPEHVAPNPLLLVPRQQRENWQKVRTIQDAQDRSVLGDDLQGWKKTTQGIRQNLAAIDYAEQATREVQRPEGRVVGDAPAPAHDIQRVAETEPASALDPSRKDGK
ncbi:hypothetical protein [Oligoflexus tunisiensis]|uniref:hypothetical protein n=1 Tax=Oligoflexus tunisiensis TaxID=708132 RepID=UPI00114CCAD5|nr:hypothetical protein [Oligoflexus tunisiensis]